jgi:hypothetical protein
MLRILTVSLLLSAALLLHAAPLQLSNYDVSGRLDYQLVRMSEPGMTDTRGQLMAAEVESTATVATAERDILDLALQWPYATQMRGIDGRGREMHFGNAYAVYKFGLGRPNLRVGQFVVPFGNLPYYETHTRPLQSLYEQSLGIRIDRGASLEGIAGANDYWVALVGGNGARSDNNDSPVALARLGRRLDLPGGTLNAGVSALYGTAMPRFSPLVDPMMDEDMPGMSMVDFTTKTRLGVDAEYTTGPTVWRAELVGGRDGDGGVNGQFLQWNRALNERQEVSLQAARWEQPTGHRLRLGAGVSHKPDDVTTLRASVERAFGHTPAEDRNETMVSLQLLREFPGLVKKR